MLSELVAVHRLIFVYFLFHIYSNQLVWLIFRNVSQMMCTGLRKPSRCLYFTQVTQKRGKVPKVIGCHQLRFFASAKELTDLQMCPKHVEARFVTWNHIYWAVLILLYLYNRQFAVGFHYLLKLMVSYPHFSYVPNKSFILYTFNFRFINLRFPETMHCTDDHQYAEKRTVIPAMQSKALNKYKKKLKKKNKWLNTKTLFYWILMK